MTQTAVHTARRTTSVAHPAHTTQLPYGAWTLANLSLRPCVALGQTGNLYIVVLAKPTVSHCAYTSPHKDTYTHIHAYIRVRTRTAHPHPHFRLALLAGDGAEFVGVVNAVAAGTRRIARAGKQGRTNALIRRRTTVQWHTCTHTCMYSAPAHRKASRAAIMRSRCACIAADRARARFTRCAAVATCGASGTAQSNCVDILCPQQHAHRDARSHAHVNTDLLYARGAVSHLQVNDRRGAAAAAAPQACATHVLCV